MVQPKVPPYFDHLIEGFQRGEVGRFVHLGHWDEPPPSDQPPVAGELERAQERLDDLLLDMARLEDRQAVLDVGCGFGGSIARINERHRGMRLVGVNVDPRQLDICRRIEPANRNLIEWKQADACDLPFPERAFERLLCIEAMFHFASRRRFFREAARLLRPGGVLVASDIVLTESARRLDVPRHVVEAPLQDGFGPWPDPWGDEGDHRELALEAGLRPDLVHDATASTCPSHRFTVPSGESWAPGEPAASAPVMLKWLHRGGHVKYLCLRFTKPPAGGGAA